MKIKNVLLSILIAAAPALLSAAQRPQPLLRPDVAVPAGLSRESAQQIIRTVLTTRGWNIKGEKPGEVQASWQKGAISALIRVTVDGKSASVQHVSSTGLSHSNDASGELIHPRYNIWMRNLQKDFGVGFSAAPKQ
jgi:hypothetical protein